MINDIAIYNQEYFIDIFRRKFLQLIYFRIILFNRLNKHSNPLLVMF